MVGGLHFNFIRWNHQDGSQRTCSACASSFINVFILVRFLSVCAYLFACFALLFWIMPQSLHNLQGPEQGWLNLRKKWWLCPLCRGNIWAFPQASVWQANMYASISWVIECIGVCVTRSCSGSLHLYICLEYRITTEYFTSCFLHCPLSHKSLFMEHLAAAGSVYACVLVSVWQ